MGNLETTRYIDIWNAANRSKHPVEDIHESVEDSYKHRT